MIRPYAQSVNKDMVSHQPDVKLVKLDLVHHVQMIKMYVNYVMTELLQHLDVVHEHAKLQIA